jgi:hypothetical protein
LALAAARSDRTCQAWGVGDRHGRGESASVVSKSSEPWFGPSRRAASRS